MHKFGPRRYTGDENTLRVGGPLHHEIGWDDVVQSPIGLRAFAEGHANLAKALPGFIEDRAEGSLSIVLENIEWGIGGTTNAGAEESQVRGGVVERLGLQSPIAWAPVAECTNRERGGNGNGNGSGIYNMLDTSARAKNRLDEHAKTHAPSRWAPGGRVTRGEQTRTLVRDRDRVEWNAPVLTEMSDNGEANLSGVTDRPTWAVNEGGDDLCRLRGCRHTFVKPRQQETSGNVGVEEGAGVQRQNGGN
ncbi:hypothetical protein OF83DRAFT_1088028 [Amylostereum chailletii]|nr:hypothetical protein OF83DRAFT_1088028 [Amylostereum chailletii]